MILSKLLVFYGYLCSWLLGFSVALAWDNNSDLITAPTNKTVYVGETANFYSETHSSCNIRTFVNDRICTTTTTNGQPVSNTVGNMTYSNCSIYNSQLSDDGARIVVHVYCHNFTSFGPVFLRVIGPPPSPFNLTIDQYCNKIAIATPALSEDATEVYIEIMRDNNTAFNITKSSFPVDLSVTSFEDRNAQYKIIVYNRNPAGLSQPREIDLLFKTVFDISSSSLQIINNKIIMTITVQVNISCLLSVPQLFNLSSNCASNNFYQVINRTTISESGLTDLSVILHSNKRKCNITVSSGDHELHIINQNTYEVQEVIISEDTSTGYFSINCTFLNGSQAKGCGIEVVNNATGEYIFDQNISRLSSTSLYAVDNSSTCLTNNGTYIIYVYIWDRYGRVNKSLVVTTKWVRVAISYQDAKNTSMSNNNTTSNIEPDKNDIKDRTKKRPPIVWIVVGCLTGLIVILMVVVIVIVFIVVMRYRKKHRNQRERISYQHCNGLEMEYVEHEYDKKEQPQNITSFNQKGSTEGTINDERDEQESKNENNESGVEMTTLEVLPNNNNRILNNNEEYISPESDTHDHDNNTLKRRSGKPEVSPSSDSFAIGLTNDFEVPFINPVDVTEVRPEVDTQPHEQNIAVSTNKPEHVTTTGDPSSTYPTDNCEAQRLNETADTKIISDGTQEIEISTNTTIQPHIVQSIISQPVQCPISESAIFPTDNSETPLLNETAKENEIMSTQPLVGQNMTSQPVQSPSDSATFPTEGSEVPLLKPEDDTIDQFGYEHSYNVDETEATNQTTLMVPSITHQLSAISEKDEQVLPSENITTSSGGKPVVSDEAPSQTVYAPPTFQLPPKQSTIVSTVPTTPTITQEFVFPTNETK